MQLLFTRHDRVPIEGGETRTASSYISNNILPLQHPLMILRLKIKLVCGRAKSLRRVTGEGTVGITPQVFRYPALCAL